MNRERDTLMDLLEGPDRRTPANAAQSEMLRALDQLFNTISFYPPEHSRCLDVGRRFHAAVTALVGNEPALRITYRQSQLWLQGQDLNDAGKEAARVIELFDILGISSLELSIEASIADLQHLVRELLAARHRAETSLGFTEMTFDDLPRTVRIELREFGRRGCDVLTAQALASKLSAAVDDIVVELTEPGQDEATLAHYREMANQLLSGLAEQFEGDASLRGAAGNRSLVDVLDLGAHAIKQILPTLLNSSDEATLHLAMEQVSQSIRPGEDQDYIRQVLDVLRRTVQAVGHGTDACEKNARIDHRWPLTDLLARIDGLPTEDLERIELQLDTQHEHVAVYLHCLSVGAPPQVQQCAAARLAEELSGRLSRASATLLVAEVGRLLRQGDPQIVDRVLPRITTPLGKASGFGLTELWQRAGQDLDVDAVALAWPHLVAEIVRDRSQDPPQDMGPLVDLAARLDPGRMLMEVQRIEATPAFAADRFNPRVFRHPTPETWALTASLLNSSKSDLFGKWMGQALRDCPPCPLAAAVGRALDGYSRHHRALVQQIFMVGKQPWPAELRRLAADLICNSLGLLDPKQRQADWVPKAVAALGDLAGPSARPLLERICTSRRMLVLWTWPGPCRTTAVKALRALDSHRSPG